MHRPFRILGLTALALFVICTGALSNSQKEMGAYCKPGACESCHVDKIPTRENHALKPCPLFHPPAKAQNGFEPVAYGDDVMLIKQLVDKYNPVRFTHKSHYEMAKMGNGCWTCHHEQNGDEKFKQCGSCHKVELKRKDLNTPRLKAAYHQQCLDCHKKWNHTADCKGCHVEKGKTPMVTLEKGLQNKYPKVVLPGKKIYPSNGYKNTKVTFYHNDHAVMFNLSCDKCHKNNECADCHDTAKKTSKPIVEASHKTCLTCHKNDACSKCHRDKEIPPFNHDSTGFSLKGAHSKLKCFDCHEKGKPIKKLSTNCNDCHSRLDMSNFDHSVTGFKLEGAHKKLVCTDCHRGGNFAAKPNCSKCHLSSSGAFNHAAISGFPLKRYHSGLACTRCHPAGKAISSLNSNCSQCHKSWPDNFNHKRVVGVGLDKTHSALGCIDCHDDNRYDKKPNCTLCHEGISYPKDKPGK